MSVSVSAPAAEAAITSTMTAIVQEAYGTADVLTTRTVAKPVVADGEVLLRVRAAGVNRADTLVMAGTPFLLRLVYGLRRPKNGVRGTDVAGTVEVVGKGVTTFKTGDEVFGWCESGFAEYVAVPAANLLPKPTRLSFEQAAVVPMSGFVALQALRDHGSVKPGDKVLINGAAGGVGTFAIQIAKSLGAEVTGVCSTRNVDMVRSVGADHVIDYSKEDFTRSGVRYDVILDNIANHSLSDLRRALTTNGTLVPNSGTTGAGGVIKAKLMTRFISQNFRNFLMKASHDDLVALRDLIDAGALTPVIDTAFPLREARAAMARVAGGHARGKVVLTA